MNMRRVRGVRETASGGRRPHAGVMAERDGVWVGCNPWIKGRTLVLIFIWRVTIVGSTATVAFWRGWPGREDAGVVRGQKKH